MNDILDTFCSKYTDLNHKNGPFYGNDFIWRSKDIHDRNIHVCHQKYYLTCVKVLGFVLCRVTTNIIGTGTAKRSFSDVNTNKSEIILFIRIDVSKEQSIV